jgi:hypothetical protein
VKSLFPLPPRNWGPYKCGSFIPPFVDVMIPGGPAYVWLTLSFDGEDLAFEEWGEETWGEPPEVPPPPDSDPHDLDRFRSIIQFGRPSLMHEWLQALISDIGWPDIFDIPRCGGEWCVMSWALEAGLAPDQPFLVRIDVPYSYRSSWEYDEWDEDYNYEIIFAQPLPKEETAKRWVELLHALQ